MFHLIVLKLCFAFSLTLLFHSLLQSVAMPLDISSKFVSNNFVLLSCYINLFLLLPNCFFYSISLHILFVASTSRHLHSFIFFLNISLFLFILELFVFSLLFFVVNHVALKIHFACTIFAIVNPST